MSRSPYTGLEPIYLYPSQVATFEAAGWVRGRDFVVYACLKCLSEMDLCECKRKAKQRK